MLLMEPAYIIGEDLTDYSKKATWNLFHSYIYSHIQILLDEYPGDVLEDISIQKSQCENITFAYQIRKNRLFQKVVHREGESAINYIKIFHNA